MIDEIQAERLVKRLEEGSSKKAKRFIKSSIRFYEKMKEKEKKFREDKI